MKRKKGKVETLIECCLSVFYTFVPMRRIARTSSMNALPYKLVRSRRRSVALVVSKDATLTVRAPLRTPVHFIESFLEERRSWIERAVTRVREEYAPVLERHYVDGEHFLFLGQEYPLCIVESASKPLVFENGEFQLFRHSCYRARALFAEWYRHQAHRVIGERTMVFAEQHVLQFGRISIKDMRSRWGSCGPDGSLNFSLRLVLAPLSVIDYVVAHELAHLTHRNHSRAFWDTVAKMHPNYRQDRRYLARSGHQLEF